MLRPGASGSPTWSRRGEVIASINVEAKPGHVFLDYRHRSVDDEWQDENYPVQLETTSCHLGGERQWFLCPARGCGKRVAILYGGEIFACRHCRQLAYPSQREAYHDRAIRKADRIRDKLGWEPGTANGHGPKPKGMRWRTFERLCAEHDTYSQAGWGAFMARYGMHLAMG